MRCRLLPPTFTSSTQSHLSTFGSPCAHLFFFLTAAFCLLASTSPSASHLLALISWITLMICFPAHTGALNPARIHGTVLSILFALAASSAPALQGFRKSVLGAGWAGEPGWVEVAEWSVFRRDGERSGEENERR
jgi:hypothetical protein